MGIVRRVQYGDRRSLISILPSELKNGRTLIDQEYLPVEYIFIRADGVGAENIKWFISDGEDYKQAFTINQLQNEDGLSEDMPNIWRVSNYGVPNMVTALVRFDKVYMMRRLNIVAKLETATVPFNVAYEVMVVKEVQSGDTSKSGSAKVQAASGVEIPLSAEAPVPTPVTEGLYTVPPAGVGEYEVPLAIPTHTTDVIVHRESVPLPITSVEQSLHPTDIISNKNIRVQTSPVEGETDRYQIVHSSQPIRKPPQTDPATAPSYKQPYSHSEIPLAPPSPQRRRRLR